MFDLTRLETLLPDQSSPAYRAQLSQLTPFYTQIEQTFNYQFVNDFMEAQIKLNAIDAEESFVRGITAWRTAHFGSF